MKDNEKYYTTVSYPNDLSLEVSNFLKTLSPQRGKILCKAMSDAIGGKTRFLELARKQRFSSVEIPNDIEIQEIELKSEFGKIPTRLYLPKNTKTQSAMLYLHGGGWVIGSPDSCTKICIDACRKLKCAVFALDYSLAPEAKFPKPVIEAANAFVEIVNRSSEFGYKCDKIFICGDSSGGNLAIATIIKLLEDKRQIPTAMAVFYPVTTIKDYDKSQSWQKFGKGYALDADVMEQFINCYINNDNDRNSQLVSPILRDDFSDFPPILILSSGCDILKNQVEDFANKMSNTNDKVRYVEIENATHIYATMEGMEESYSIGFSEVENFIKRFLDS